MSGFLIPYGWDEATDGFSTMTMTVPNNPHWRAVIKGKVLELTDSNEWDEETGDADTATTLALDIFDSITVTVP